MHRRRRRTVRSAAGRVRGFECRRVGYPRRTQAARPRELGELQSAQGDHDPRRNAAQQHRKDRAQRATGPRRPCVGAGQLLRASAELLNAANGVRPLGREGYITLPVFAFGWPTTEMSPLYLAGSVLDAVRRGMRGDFRGARGRIALVLTAIAWALLWLIHRRNVASHRISKSRCARRWATTTKRSPRSRNRPGAAG